MTQDEAALLARFKEQFDLADKQVQTAGKVGMEPDPTKVWVGYTVRRGPIKRITRGINPEYLQSGTMILRVMVPRELGARAGDEQRNKFENLFIDWQSPDSRLIVKSMDHTSSETDTYFVLLTTCIWHSRRNR